MKTLQQVTAEADRQKVAVGHSNSSDLMALKAVYAAAREVNVPVETEQQDCRKWGGAQVILARAPSSKAMSELIDGLARHSTPLRSRRYNSSSEVERFKAGQRERPPIPRHSALLRIDRRASND
jgi:hypothetical protein